MKKVLLGVTLALSLISCGVKDNYSTKEVPSQALKNLSHKKVDTVLVTEIFVKDETHLVVFDTKHEFKKDISLNEDMDYIGAGFLFFFILGLCVAALIFVDRG